MRGLKFVLIQDFFAERSSHRSRGAWIEILDPSDKLNELIMSHRSRGAWIEIDFNKTNIRCRLCRIAHAVRGLKSNTIEGVGKSISSHRSRGAWIEICNPSRYRIKRLLSHRSRGAWIEIDLLNRERHL